MKKQTPKKEGNLYDKIIKENLTALMPAIFRRMLNIQDYRLENLPEIKQQTTVEVEPDFLKRFFNNDFPDGAIIQIEFQTDAYEKMNGRMLEYLGILFKKFDIPVIQSVIYIGKGKAKFSNTAKWLGLDYHFRVLNMEDFSYKTFVESAFSEEVILSILADREDLNEEEILELILNRLVQLNGNSKEIYKFTKQLMILSRLRDMQKVTILKANDMLRLNLDMTTDELYLEGEKKGIQKGIQKGISKGLEKGKIISNILAIEKMLMKGLSYELIEQILPVSLDFIKTVEKELIQKENVFKALKNKNLEGKEIAKKYKVSEIFVEAFQYQLSEKN